MDICLVNPPTTNDGGSLYFPMALLCLSSYLATRGFEAKISDYELDVRSHCIPTDDFLAKSVRDLKRRYRSPVYGITTVTTNFAMALLMAEEIKRQMPNSKVILGGPQVSSVPWETLRSFPAVDAIAVGEGEYTLEEYLKRLKSGGSQMGIAGLLCREHLNAPDTFVKRDLEDDLDRFPPVDFSKIRLMEYAVLDRISVGYFLPFIEAGRGCPFNCTFCSTSIMWGRKYRVKSPRRIYQELAAIREKYGFDSFELLHDNFTTSRKYLHEFCDYFAENNEAKIQWSCASRVDTLHVEDLDRMVRGGCDGVFFGVEAGSAHMQQVIRKRIDLSKYDTLLTECRRRDFRVNVGFILGFPEEGVEDVEATLQWALTSKLRGVANVTINRLRVNAGTEIARDHGNRLSHLSESEISEIEREKCKDLAERFPDLFVSAYALPHPCYEENVFENLLSFFRVGIKHYALNLEWLTQRQGLQLLDVFQRWEQWALDQPGVDPRAPVSPEFINANFLRFIREAVIPYVATRNFDRARTSSVKEAH